jgi:hypothetical protein
MLNAILVNQHNSLHPSLDTDAFRVGFEVSHTVDAPLKCKPLTDDLL